VDESSLPRALQVHDYYGYVWKRGSMPLLNAKYAQAICLHVLPFTLQYNVLLDRKIIDC
jgi:hypothetical protein